MEFYKNNKGITLLALVITIIIIIILAGITINAVVGDNGLIYQARSSKDMTSNEIESEGISTNDVMTEYANVMAEDNEIGLLSETKANAPVLTKNMVPVKWNGYTEVETTQDDPDWYDYERQNSGTENGGTSRWANGKNKDGGYFVWIPRYAYKITYYTDANKTTISTDKTLYGDIEIVFLEGETNNYVDKNGVAGIAQKIVGDVGEDYTNSQKNGDKYTVHPAFTNGASNGYANGEWDQEISGFWVAKYEMSMETNGVHTETSSEEVGNVLTGENIKAVSKPGVSSWRYIMISNCYINGANYEANSNSHSMKNSEWGAVAYLTYSEYGRNGTKITINNSTSFITGNAANGIDSPGELGLVNAYNTDKGVLASTTGNIYGVYDMVGGAWEYMMAFITSNNSYLTEYGSSFTKTDAQDGNTSYRAQSTKYATAYPQGESTSTEVGIEKSYNYWNVMYGDAIAEISIGDPSNSWRALTIYDGLIEFDTLFTTEPFMGRGGHSSRGEEGGVFLLADSVGFSDSTGSFRVVLIP